MTSWIFDHHTRFGVRSFNGFYAKFPHSYNIDNDERTHLTAMFPIRNTKWTIKSNLHFSKNATTEYGTGFSIETLFSSLLSSVVWFLFFFFFFDSLKFFYGIIFMHFIIIAY